MISDRNGAKPVVQRSRVVRQPVRRLAENEAFLIRPFVERFQAARRDLQRAVTVVCAEMGLPGAEFDPVTYTIFARVMEKEDGEP